MIYFIKSNSLGTSIGMPFAEKMPELFFNNLNVTSNLGNIQNTLLPLIVTVMSFILISNKTRP